MTPTAHRIRTATTVAALLGAAALAGPPTVSAATVPVVNGTTLTITGDNDPDRVTIADNGEKLTIATPNLKSVVADGGAGDDILTGNNDADTLSGGDGDDRVVGARGGDTMAGGAGNDVLVWNNGDGSDRMDGDGNAD